MYKVHCLNNISAEGLAVLSADYELTDSVEEADAILVRSADMHEMELPANLKVIARAGAGVNNIPLQKCADAGIRQGARACGHAPCRARHCRRHRVG